MGAKGNLEGEEEDGEIKSSIQAQEVDMQGGEDGEKRRTLKVLDVRPTDVCKNEWE